MSDSFASTQAVRPGLFRKYAVAIGLFVTSALLLSGLVDMYFSFRESRSSLLQIQREKALNAANQIDHFIGDIVEQLEWGTHLAYLPEVVAATQRDIDFGRIMKQAPAISQLGFYDHSGSQQLVVSRLARTQAGGAVDLSKDAIFRKARRHGHAYGEVYFKHGSEPHIGIGVAEPGKRGGVIVAEVNLQRIQDVIQQIQQDNLSLAYAVDERGFLIAHPDIALVLRRSDYSKLPQVSAALGSEELPGGTGDAADGSSVISSNAHLPPLNWWVFVDSPTSQALQPAYDSLYRTGLLLLLGIVFALIAGILLTRRMVRPIRELQQAAAEIGAGNLDHRINVASKDELQGLAEDLSRMAQKLKTTMANVERLNTLKRYFSPHLAEMIVSTQHENVTDSHRQFIIVVFCDLRKFTAFSSQAEPEDAMNVLREYFEVLGRYLQQYGATIDHFAGDGLMAFFNDPVPCEKPARDAVTMSIEVRSAIRALIAEWRKAGIDLGFGIGIAGGYATIGSIGTKSQFHYTAIGSVSNLASRLCDEAEDGQILVNETVLAEVENLVEAVPLNPVTLKGFPSPVPVFNISSLSQTSRNED